MITDLLVKALRQSFEDTWSSKWEVIKSLLPEGDLKEGASRSESLLQDFGDLYFLTKADLLRVGTIQDSSAEKLLLTIATSKKRLLDKVILSLGIRHVNRRWSKKLADKYRNIWRLGLEPWRELINEPGLGDSIASSIVSFFHDEANWKMVERMRFCGVDSLDGYQTDQWSVWPDETKMTYKEYIQILVASDSPARQDPQIVKEDSVTGKVFMFTGRLNSMTRAQAQSLVESKGGLAGSGLTKDTTYLVVGDTGDREGTNKLMLAHMYGTTKLSEEDFLALLGEA